MVTPTVELIIHQTHLLHLIQSTQRGGQVDGRENCALHSELTVLTVDFKVMIQ